jgi:hypothetical protein
MARDTGVTGIVVDKDAIHEGTLRDNVAEAPHAKVWALDLVLFYIHRSTSFRKSSCHAGNGLQADLADMVKKGLTAESVYHSPFAGLALAGEAG